ncbi:lipocalin-like domain-containing protein [Kribbella sp.]|uniref:lipocalin-like domain-containing protein n=1 Tax=Kribbella sp. TaxID=1871183 RepID=UPI002D69E2B1|nr:lipocalin-like domain-containing protein [Kribbella sp.]HZX07709.1 lipocalin-like domain-containing protein [Kribbella sp.]
MKHLHLSNRRISRVIAVLTFGAALAVAATSAGADAGTAAVSTADVARPTDGPAFPVFVKLPADQAAHPDARQEWWYVVGHVEAHGHRFGYEVTIGGGQQPQAIASITDRTSGAYYTTYASYSPDRTRFSTTELDVRTPSATLSGPMDAMRLHATLPVGAIDVTLSARGPALYNNGTGLMPFLGGTSYYYSLPSLETRGTLEVDGRAYTVAGESWLDRQWGTWDWSTMDKWTWMPLQLSNGDRINLWDLFAEGKELAYATVLHPDGTHELVGVQPLAATTSGFWTSPATGQRYGTRWTVKIAALDADLTVVAEPRGQERLGAFGGTYEGASTVTGRVRGKPITGRTYVEQNGNWHPNR